MVQRGCLVIGQFYDLDYRVVVVYYKRRYRDIGYQLVDYKVLVYRL